MKEASPTMKVPELIVFAKAITLGFLCTEIFRAAFFIGAGYARTVAEARLEAVVTLEFLCIAIVVAYGFARGARSDITRLARSKRFDLLLSMAAGSYANVLATPWLFPIHALLQNADPRWAPLTLTALTLVFLSSLLRTYWPRKTEPVQLVFLEDTEIGTEDQDALGVSTQAYAFADTVLASNAHTGLVFGIDGPWGVGKSSFIRLAEHRWRQKRPNTVIVVRFELLRYASESDLPQRFIRELAVAVRKHAFAPEFSPIASRYSKILKGKAEFSLFGLKYSFEPADETIDDMLDELDNALKRIDLRVIIVIDDLDRLEPKAINNVLFAVRRTFSLSQATYVLCYDTEILANKDEISSDSRLFLEKFINVKISLFVDSKSLTSFLERDWRSTPNALQLVPSDNMLKLASILSGMAELLSDRRSPDYMRVLGDMRKVKRFVNSVLMMQIDRINLAKTDFNRIDLINLILIHINYPGLFREIYIHETEGRSGPFSVFRDSSKRQFINSSELQSIIDKQPAPCQFLMRQLFWVEDLAINTFTNVDADVLSSRACFNDQNHRNLEAYLKLIVRFVTPEPKETFIFYREAVDRVRAGTPIAAVLSESDFCVDDSVELHDKFWSLLVNQSRDFTRPVAESAITALVEFLPRYSSLGHTSLRQRSVYALARLLDSVGWGQASKRHALNAQKDVVEIARRIFGDKEFNDRGLIEQLCSTERGVLGWHDLLIFRLVCSNDRGGQLFNLSSALIAHEDPGASTTGQTASLAVKGMRKISQEVFRLFRSTYIDRGRNFYTDVDNATSEEFLGKIIAGSLKTIDSEVDRWINVARAEVKSFVIYQLSNVAGPTGAGVGCGYYDEIGDADARGIASIMNRYVFETCFDPIDEKGATHFADHCLSNLTNGFFLGEDLDGYLPTKEGLPGGLDPAALAAYWRENRASIIALDLPSKDREVVTSNYNTSYREGLPRVFDVLDALSDYKSGLDG
jgi:hypothetical protein